MQSTFVDVTNHLQLCSAELPGCYIVIQADLKLTGEFTAPTIGLLTLFFWWNMAN